MKVSELTGVHLDYWVAKAHRHMHGHEFRLGLTEDTAIMLRNLETGVDVCWVPSNDWAQGGPIIERERIAVFPSQTKEGAVMWTASVEHIGVIETFGFYFERPTDACLDAMAYGPTPLIAAMRAFVASKVGEEVSD